MDFYDLKENAREAKLDYGEAESLVRFFNFHANGKARRRSPQITASSANDFQIFTLTSSSSSPIIESSPRSNTAPAAHWSSGSVSSAA
jgi:hypothetical protein